METFIVRTPSVTYARKGQKILEDAGYRCRLTRTGAQGCAWGIEISAPSFGQVLRLLEDSGVIFTL